MLDVTRKNIKGLMENGLIKFSIVYPLNKNGHFRLANTISIRLSSGGMIIIPAGFEFDGSSSPRFLWWLFPSYGDFFFAALIHDYLYHTQYMAEDIGMGHAQKFADEEMLNWSNILNKKTIGKKVDNYFRFYAVRLFGKKVFRK
ncbi:unnamed protein product [marine sediment metagenome]|uniref:DUF1353 domain-containing protein n=1 Tax=marine sediment metagenome TaxID=412755 RepID=X1BSQ3_9ZZZZ